MNWHLIGDIVSLIFILPGAFMVFSAAVGSVRFKSTMSRIHAITKPQTTGLVLMVIGTLIRVVTHPTFGPGERGDIGVLLLLVLFALMTNPVTAQRLGRIARREGLYGDEDSLSRNEHPTELQPRRGVASKRNEPMRVELDTDAQR